MQLHQPGAVDAPMNDNQPTLDAMAGHPGGTREDLERAGRNYGVLAPTA